MKNVSLSLAKFDCLVLQKFELDNKLQLLQLLTTQTDLLDLFGFLAINTDEEKNDNLLLSFHILILLIL